VNVNNRRRRKYSLLPLLAALMSFTRQDFTLRAEVMNETFGISVSMYFLRVFYRANVFLCISVGEWPRRTPIYVRDDGERKCCTGGGRDGVHQFR